MAHTHVVYDADPHFNIDENTRAITYMSSEPLIIIQGDHNSERFTFELPRHIDGHDMMLCNKVQVHFINIDSNNTTTRNTDYYEVDDLQIKESDETTVVCSWLVSQAATQLVGSLNFVLRFACMTGSKVDYAWHTAVYSGVTISTSINASEVIAEQYNDILEQWYYELIMAGTMGVNVVDEAKVSALNEIDTAKNEALGDVAEVGGIVASDDEPTDPRVSTWLRTSNDNKTIKLLTSEDYDKLWDEIHYKPVDITSFKNDINTAELGSTVNNVTLTWTINKTPSELKLDGSIVTGTSKTLTNAGISSNKTFTLAASDERGATDSMATSITFYNRVIWGASTSGTHDSNFINALEESGSSALSNSIKRTITVNVGSREYLYYAFPSRLATSVTPVFTVGGFGTEFDKIASAVSRTNTSGYTENYDIYRSPNPSTGSTTVVITTT